MSEQKLPILSGKKIMLVATSRAIRDLLAPMFNQIGAGGVRLSSVANCPKDLDTYRPDLLICHFEQDGGNAVDFIRSVRQKVPNQMALVLVLEQKDSGMSREATHAGASGVLMIPFSVNDLKKLTETVLAKPEATAGLRFGPKPKS
jgi:DNA-binding NtrC family response regulator